METDTETRRETVTATTGDDHGQRLQRTIEKLAKRAVESLRQRLYTYHLNNGAVGYEWPPVGLPFKFNLDIGIEISPIRKDNCSFLLDAKKARPFAKEILSYEEHIDLVQEEEDMESNFGIQNQEYKVEEEDDDDYYEKDNSPDQPKIIVVKSSNKTNPYVMPRDIMLDKDDMDIFNMGTNKLSEFSKNLKRDHDHELDENKEEEDGDDDDIDDDDDDDDVDDDCKKIFEDIDYIFYF